MFFALKNDYKMVKKFWSLFFLVYKFFDHFIVIFECKNIFGHFLLQKFLTILEAFFGWKNFFSHFWLQNCWPF